MPLMAYFWKVGATLLALLLVVDFCLPKPPTIEKAALSQHTIRIYSDAKWPERVDFDTRSPAIVASAPATTIAEAASASDPIGPSTFVDKPTVANALALLPRQQSPRPDAVERKRPRKTQRAAIKPQRHLPPQMALAARQGQFDWFRSPYW